MMIEILIDGKVTLHVPATIHADGTIWSIGSPSRPVLNGALAESRGIAKTTCAAQVKAGKYTQDVLACGMKLGDNFGGRVARDKDAAADEARRAADVAMSPIDREKQTLLHGIAAAERAARRCDRTEDDVEYQRLTWKAEKLQDDFYARFPEEKIADKARNLRSRAAHIRDVADGAMLYDCDGSLSYEDQCERRDAGHAEAVAIEAQAAKLETAGAK